MFFQKLYILLHKCHPNSCTAASGRVPEEGLASYHINDFTNRYLHLIPLEDECAIGFEHPHTLLGQASDSLLSQTIYQVIPSFDKFIHPCCGLT